MAHEGHRRNRVVAALHLHEQAKLARACGVPQVVEIRNGDLLRLSPGPVEVIDKVATGRLYRDGRLLMPPADSGIADRRRLAFSGMVSVSMVLDARGDLVEDPQVAVVDNGVIIAQNDDSNGLDAATSFTTAPGESVTVEVSSCCNRGAYTLRVD